MHPATRYVIRQATAVDARTLRRLAALDGQRPLLGPPLVGERSGIPAVALSVTDGRLIADPSQRTAVLTQMLRMRAGALRAYSCAPSVTERIRAAMAPFRAAHARPS